MSILPNHHDIGTDEGHMKVPIYSLMYLSVQTDDGRTFRDIYHFAFEFYRSFVSGGDVFTDSPPTVVCLN